MFIDIRTHLIALVAVFLALGIGILIGVDMIGGQGLLNQEKALANRLERDFDNLRNQNALLASQLTQEEKAMSAEETFANQAATALVSGRLAGRRVALVIAEPGFQDPALLDMLHAAGAAVGPVVVLDPPGSVGPATWKEVEALLGVRGKGQAYRLLAAMAASGLANGTWAKGAASLPLWQVSGDLGQPVTGAVVVTGGQQAADLQVRDFCLPLIRTLIHQGMTVVAGETTDVPVSDIPALETTGVTTVDDLDLTPGLVSAVLGLDGARGNFGVKATAESLMPAVTPPSPPAASTAPASPGSPAPPGSSSQGAP